MRSGDSSLVFPGAKGVIKEGRHIVDRISAATVLDPNPDALQAKSFKWHDARRTFGTVAELVGVGNAATIYCPDVAKTRQVAGINPVIVFTQQSDNGNTPDMLHRLLLKKEASPDAVLKTQATTGDHL